jgi:hypothetical protein
MTLKYFVYHEVVNKDNFCFIITMSITNFKIYHLYLLFLDIVFIYIF